MHFYSRPFVLSKLIWWSWCSIPILALVDGDAYGLDILSVYKHGSASLRHENAKLAAERVEWIGVWASELAECVSFAS